MYKVDFKVPHKGYIQNEPTSTQNFHQQFRYYVPSSHLVGVVDSSI